MLDQIPLNKNDNFKLYEEFKRKFKIKDNTFFLSNSFEVSYYIL